MTDYKAALEKIAALMKSEPYDPSTDEDFNPDDYGGGNIDDAWYHGHATGWSVGLWAAAKIAQEALKQPEE